MARPLSLLNRNTFNRLICIGLTFLAVAVPITKATPCVVFDSGFNLYALGFGGKDYKLGTQDKWSSTISPVDITSSGRPPFDGTQTTCYLAQFFNAIYVLDGDMSKPSAVHIYDAQAMSWSTQDVNTGGPDSNTLVAILDHDTNVFYALADGSVFSLDLGQQKQANSTPLSWNDVGHPSFQTTNYSPTMALAQNHIHFLGVPGAMDGTAFIFVIHFSFFQSEPQLYVTSGGSNFPSKHGKTASVFEAQGVQQKFAFIPDGSANTFIVNVENNSTLVLPGPTDKTSSTYAASTSALVQLASSGSIYFLALSPGGAANSASWARLDVTGLAALPSGNSSSNGTTSTGNGTGAANGTATAAAPTGSGGSGKNQNGGLSLHAGIMTLLGGIGALALVIYVY